MKHFYCKYSAFYRTTNLGDQYRWTLPHVFLSVKSRGPRVNR